MVKAVMQQLITYGAVKRGQLGVSMYAVTPEMAHSLGLTVSTGALVSQVLPGSAADRAGVRTGDVVTSVNSQPSEIQH